MISSEAQPTTFAQLIESGILEIGDGYRAKNEELGGYGPIFLRAGHVTDTRIDFSGVDRFRAELASAVASKMSRMDDVVVTTKGNSTGRTTFVTPEMPPFVYSPHLSYWRSLQPERLVPGFLRAWSRGREFANQLDGMKRSTDMAPYLSLTDQRRLRITLPAPPVQKVIGDLLSALDTKSEHNRRVCRVLEVLARSIFKAWFVDFEPIRAKAAGERRFPGMPQEVFNALPDRFQDAALGPIPEGWSICPLGDAFELSKAQIDPQGYADGFFEHFSIPAFDDGQEPVVESGGGIKSNKFVVLEGCILFSKLNPHIPRIWLPPKSRGNPQIASTEFLVCLPRSGWTRDYLYCQLQQAEFRDKLAQHAIGTSNSHQRLRPQDFLAQPIVVPAALLREAFQAQIGPLFALRASRRAESLKLAELRNYLLPKLLSGHVRVNSDLAGVPADADA